MLFKININAEFFLILVKFNTYRLIKIIEVEKIEKEKWYGELEFIKLVSSIWDAYWNPRHVKEISSKIFDEKYKLTHVAEDKPKCIYEIIFIHQVGKNENNPHTPIIRQLNVNINNNCR